MLYYVFNGKLKIGFFLHLMTMDDCKKKILASNGKLRLAYWELITAS